MSNAAARATIHRVLLTMDSPLALSFLPAAAELAAHMQAELQGLFVEDANLLRLSELPFAQEICSSSAVTRPLTLEMVERRWHALAEQLRTSLAETARRAHVTWSFQVARGAIHDVFLQPTHDADLLLVGHQLVPRARAQSAGLGGTTRTGAGRSTTTAESSRLPIAVVFDNSPAAQRAMSIACQAAAGRGAAIDVILPVSDIPLTALRTNATRILEAHGVTGRFAAESVQSFGQLRRALEYRKFGLVLLPVDSALLEEVTLAQLAGDLGSLVGLVR